MSDLSIAEKKFHDDRLRKLWQELKIALDKTSADDLKAWGRASAARLPTIASMRKGSIVAFLDTVNWHVTRSGFTGRELLAEVRALVRAVAEGRKGLLVLSPGLPPDGWGVVQQCITRATAAVGKVLENVPAVFALALGFLPEPDDIDKSGCIPSAEWNKLFGSHHIILARSIVTGTVVDGAILAFADLADIVCRKISASERDPFWSKLVEAKNNFVHELAKVAINGIIYHLAADATLQPGPYCELPDIMPTEAKQALQAMNAVIESNVVDEYIRGSRGRFLLLKYLGFALKIDLPL